MKTFFLRSLPYFIAFAIGIILYIVTVIHIKDVNLNGLMINVAAGLLSVPLIFIFYEIVKDYCDKTVNDSIVSHLYFELNNSVIQILGVLNKLLNINISNTEELLKYSQIHKSTLKKMITIDEQTQNNFKNVKISLDNTIHNTQHFDMIGNHDIHIILNISKQVNIITRELQCINKEEDKNQLIESTAFLLISISNWAQSQEEDFLEHPSFKLLKRMLS